jgi:hypothetical protein
MSEGLAITCASRSLPLTGTVTLSATQTSTLCSLSQEEGALDGGGGEEAVVRCHNQTGLPHVA